MAQLNRRHLEEHPGEDDLEARIASYELAARMQSAAKDALDLSQETQATQQMYGLDNPKCAHFARQCLIARRLVENGVRFVQIYSGGTENEKSWDGHTNIEANHRGFAAETDTPVAALLADLKQRGLLDSTLVVWGGEFGRLPLVQKGGTGRDHNPHAFTTWMARSLSTIRKSSTREPSGLTAWARTPAPPGTTSSARRSGTRRCRAWTKAALLSDRNIS